VGDESRLSNRDRQSRPKAARDGLARLVAQACCPWPREMEVIRGQFRLYVWAAVGSYRRCDSCGKHAAARQLVGNGLVRVPQQQKAQLQRPAGLPAGRSFCAAGLAIGRPRRGGVPLTMGQTPLNSSPLSGYLTRLRPNFASYFVVLTISTAYPTGVRVKIEPK
jgi:hypothetical protein